MAEVITVARPYAEAVFKLAKAKNSLSAWSDTLQLAAHVAEDERIKQLAANPVIETQKLGDLFLSILGDNLNEEGKNLIFLLAENKRIDILPHVSAMFEQLKAQHEGVLEANITSAFAMDDMQVRKLVVDLEQKFKRSIEAKVSVDPELIGGVMIEIGDEILDTSVRGKLETMAVALKS